MLAEKLFPPSTNPPHPVVIDGAVELIESALRAEYERLANIGKPWPEAPDEPDDAEPIL